MGHEIIKLDTPKDLILSDVERKIVEMMSSNRSPKDISMDLGIPKNAITNLMRKPGVKEFISELIDARNQVMKLRLPDLLMGIIEDKVTKNQDDEESRLADLSRKDIADLIKELTVMLKTTDSTSTNEAEDKFSKIYMQINQIQRDN